MLRNGWLQSNGLGGFNASEYAPGGYNLNAFILGQDIGDGISVVQGAVEIVIGAGVVASGLVAEGSGVAASATGVGAVVGIPTAATGVVTVSSGVAIIGHGSNTFVNGLLRFSSKGKNDISSRKVKRQRKKVKEPGQQFEEIQKAQRIKGRNKIQSTKKSKQKDKIDIKNEAEKVLNKDKQN